MESPRPTSVLIVGAGLAGLACARVLVEGGCRVRLVDKGRRPGGRLATRERASVTFDHGAQHFSARGEAFRAQVEDWRAAGVVAPWGGQVVHFTASGHRPSPGRDVRWVGTPGMSAIAAHLAEGLDVCCGRRIERLHRRDGRWFAEGDDLARAADVAIVTTPAPQALPLLREAPSLQGVVAEVEMTSTWTVLAEFAEALPQLPDAGGFEEGALAWVARDSSKPGRMPGERWVLHATPAWTRHHLEEPRAVVGEALLDLFRRAAGMKVLPERTYLEVHRWRYSAVQRPVGRDCLWDRSLRIGVAADWCIASRVEDAWRSGVALGRAVLGEDRG